MAYIQLTNVVFEYDPIMHLFVVSFNATNPLTHVTSRYVARFQPTEDPMVVPPTSTTQEAINSYLQQTDSNDNVPWTP
jgi:hypothetical protein